MGLLHVDADLALRFDTLGAPVQISGFTGAGAPIYYRERHDRWRVEVAGEVIAEGTREFHWSMADHVHALVGALWHPYMSDQYNAREDERAARRSAARRSRRAR